MGKGGESERCGTFLISHTKIQKKERSTLWAIQLSPPSTFRTWRWGLNAPLCVRTSRLTLNRQLNFTLLFQYLLNLKLTSSEHEFEILYYGVLGRQEYFDSLKKKRIFCVMHTQIHVLDLWSPNKIMCPETVSEFYSSTQIFLINLFWLSTEPSVMSW